MTTNITKKNTLDILILAQLIKNEEFRGIVFPYLTEKYFEDRFIKVTFKEIQSFINKYHYVPTKEALLISFQNNSNIRIFNEDDKKTLYDVINDGIYGPQKETYKIDWLLEVTEDFCRKKAIYNALTTSIEIHSGLTSSKELGIDAIPSILSEALSISFNKKIGVDYFSDDEERYDFYGSQETGILTDIDYFN
ncbi:MAG: DNA primase, partial [Nanoarchaeota archaeon]|nr:DNA primase [Nanoarchaeota archaeon]